MRKAKFSESQIAGILQEADVAVAVTNVARKRGISDVTFSNGDPDTAAWASRLLRLREIEHHNARLKRIYADLSGITPC